MPQLLVLLILAALLPILSILLSLRLLYAAFTALPKAWNILIAIDDTFNVAFNGALGQTISYRAAVAQVEGRKWGCILCRWLDQVDAGHCNKAIMDKKQNLIK